MCVYVCVESESKEREKEREREREIKSLPFQKKITKVDSTSFSDDSTHIEEFELESTEF